MKNKIKLLLIVAGFGLVLVNINANFTDIHNGKGLNLQFLSKAMSQTENPQPPKGDICKEELCSLTVGTGVTVTYYGHYSHCVTSDNPSDKCISSECNKECDIEIPGSN